MPLLTDTELKAFPEPTTRDVVPNHVARYWDMIALADKQPCKVIGPDAMLRDKPGFDVEFLTRGSIPETPYSTPRHEILMVMRGHWKLSWDGHEKVLAPGDTCAVPPGLEHSLAPNMTGESSLFRIRNTDDPAGPTWKPH
jgi:mannose-6-phosphate isomerase-like protein (cupin superfamily)